MTYAQVKAGQKLHLAFEAGEGYSPDRLIPAGHIGAPLCNRPWDGHYRMTINVPLAYACKNCLRVAKRLGLRRPTIGVVVNL